MFAFSERMAQSIFAHRQAYAEIKLYLSLIPDEPEPLMRWRIRQISRAIAFFDNGSYALSAIQASRALIPVSEIPAIELSWVIGDALDAMEARVAMLRLAQIGF